MPVANPITYPSRIWDGKQFVPNANREQSSENFTTVAVKKTNEVLGFPDGMSIDEMQFHINGDLNGTITNYRPSFYERNIRDPLSNLGIDMFQPKFIMDIKPTPERAFVTSLTRGATADIIKPQQSDKEAQAYPAQAFAGNIVGALIGLKGIGSLLNAVKLPAFAGYAAKVTGNALGKGKVAEIASKAVPAAIQSGAVGGVYGGVAKTANEIRDEEHPEISKIGEAVLHDTLWWGTIGAVTGPATKPVGVSASAGLGYLMAKADGASETDALLNGSVLAGFHLLSTHGNKPEAREAIVKQTEKTIADYVKAKNPMLAEPVAEQTAREMIYAESENIIETKNKELEPKTFESVQGKEAVKEVLKSQESTIKMIENISNQILDIKGKPETTTIEGTGETKTRSLSAGVEETAIAKKLSEGFGELPEYQTVNMQEQAKKANDLMTKDYEQARRIAMGEEKAPEGVIPESLFVAVENKAIMEGDVNTLRDLATSSRLSVEATTMGQRIRTLGERDADSPVGAIKEIQKVREEVAKKRAKIKDVESEKKKIAKEIKKEVKKNVPTKETWESFVNSIIC